MSNKVLEVFVLTHHLVPCDLSHHELVGTQQEVDYAISSQTLVN